MTKKQRIIELEKLRQRNAELEQPIEDLAKKMQKKFGIHIHLADDKQFKVLNEDLLVLVFRAVQELLFNIVKHAKTQEVRVSQGL